MKLLITILAMLDKDSYPIPADENVEEEVAGTIEDVIYDIDGLAIKKIKVEKK
jgi:hypothetical protein